MLRFRINFDRTASLIFKAHNNTGISLRNCLKILVGFSISATAIAWSERGQPQIVNQSSRDITLLSANVLRRTVGSSVSLAQCDKVFTSGNNLGYDCKDALEKAYQLPLIHKHAYVRVERSEANSRLVPIDGFNIPIVEIRLLAREDSFKDSGSLGFYLTNPVGIIYFESRAIRVEKTVRMRNGHDGVILRFIALFPRAAGTSPTQLVHTLGFKPFIDFHDRQASKIFRNWDIDPNEGYDNYLLLKGYDLPLRDILNIDRQDLLLADDFQSQNY